MRFGGRRAFLKRLGGLPLLQAWASLLSSPSARSATKRNTETVRSTSIHTQSDSKPVTLFLCGDVMTGRGIDQVLPYPTEPTLYEPYVKDARRYVQLAERAHGPIPRPIPLEYIWGEALGELAHQAAHARIINLETAVTGDGKPWPRKGIHYRMHPRNLGCITAAAIDCCVLANNHAMDWGYAGLEDTLAALERAGLRIAGAGRDLSSAEAPAVIDVSGRRVLVFALGTESSGVPRAWAATRDRPGIALLDDLSEDGLRGVAERIQSWRRTGDIVVASIHWGANWGYRVPAEHRRFARGLIDTAGVDVVHGHSSHHPIAIEVYRDRPILYGCGDFINDYEGIGGHEEFRGDLSAMYFITLDGRDRRLLRLELTPMQIRRFRLQRSSPEDALWLRDVLNRESVEFGSRVDIDDNNRLTVTVG